MVYFIIFGAALLPDGTASGSLTRRVAGAVAFAKSFQGPRFIVTGGVGRYGNPEAWVMRDLLLRMGMSAQDILVEDRARDTLESVRFCNALLIARGDAELIVPSTSSYHLPRCATLLRLLGYTVRVPTVLSDRPHLGTWKWLIYTLKEVIALPYDALLLLIRR